MTFLLRRCARTSRRWGFSRLVILSLGLGQACATAHELPAQSEIEQRLVDRPLVDFAAPDLKGNTVQLSKLKGKVVLLNFWGIWCPPCRIEIPELVELHRELKERGFEIVAVNIGDPREDVPPYVEKERVRFPVVYDDGFVDAYQITAFPTNIVIDRRGRIRFVLEGYGEGSIKQLRVIIEYLLAHQAAAAH